MRRRNFVALLGTGALGALMSAKAADRKRPNILFIAVDDLRPQLGCYGHTEMSSPNIDALAKRGTIFERAYCNVPTCGPSRVGVLTGKRTSSGQWRTKNLKEEFTSLPLLFKRNGYTAISNGKVFHHMHDRKQDWSEPPWRSVAVYHGKGDWAGYNNYDLWRNEESGQYVSPKGRGPYCESADVPDEAYQDGKVARKTIDDLERLKDSGKPFFLASGFWRPHLPFNAPKKYWDRYERDEIDPAPNRFRPKNAPGQCRSSKEIEQYARTGTRKAEIEFHKEARHAYYACVSYVDTQIGKVLDALEELGLAENTIVVLWGDHGWNLGEHNFWGKHNTLDNSLHAPLILHDPRLRQNNRSERLVEFVDIYPTLCDLAGIEKPRRLDGASFAPLLSDSDRKWKQAVFARWRNARAVKTDRYLYTQWKNGDRMLFDHEVDPDESENIAEKPESKKIVERMSKLLE